MGQKPQPPPAAETRAGCAKAALDQADCLDFLDHSHPPSSAPLCRSGSLLPSTSVPGGCSFPCLPAPQEPTGFQAVLRANTSWTCRSIALELGPPDSASRTCKGDGAVSSQQQHPTVPSPQHWKHHYLLSWEDDAVLPQHRPELVHEVLSEAGPAATGTPVSIETPAGRLVLPGSPAHPPLLCWGVSLPLSSQIH